MGTRLSENNLGQFGKLEGRCLLFATPLEMPARFCQFRIILDIVLGCGSFNEVKLSAEIAQQLVANGIRLTKQREEVFGILLQKRDHPTATEVFLRVLDCFRVACLARLLLLAMVPLLIWQSSTAIVFKTETSRHNGI